MIGDDVALMNLPGAENMGALGLRGIVLAYKGDTVGARKVLKHLCSRGELCSSF